MKHAGTPEGVARPAGAPAAVGDDGDRMAGAGHDSASHDNLQTPTDIVDAVFATEAGAALQPDGPDPAVVQVLQAWRGHLAAAGVACRGIALHAIDARHRVGFDGADASLTLAWADACTACTADKPVVVTRLAGSVSADLLLVSRLQLPDGLPGSVGVLLAPPHHDRLVQVVLLAVAWLQLSLTANSLAHNQRAAGLLELLGHVASQAGARAGAQEWINRSAAWVREDALPPGAGFALTLFEQRQDTPHWWVAADTAWAEKGSPAVQDAAELAARAALEGRELLQAPWWAMPLFDQGRVAAVLVAWCDVPGVPALPEPARTLLRASASLGEPLLRQWRLAERPVHHHAWASLQQVWRKLWGPGHLTWKAGAAALVLALVVLLLWPVPDRVSANTVIEGGTRQVLTAPFDGFIAQVLVRPGERVQRGQPMLRLDDRDLLLEQGKVRSERDQAAAKLRQAMAEHDAAAMALVQAELQQAESQLALVQAKLARVALLAPIDGLVVSGDWAQQLGGPVETGKELFEVATTQAYRVVLQVPDRDITRVAVGQRGVLRLTGQPQSGFDFELRRVTATATVQDGSNGFRVEADWVGQAPPLSPGMQGVGKIEVGHANLLTLWTRSTIDWLRLKLWAWWW